MQTANRPLLKPMLVWKISKKVMDVAQTFGASSSYARKYALNGLFLIDDTKDYDSDEYHNQVNNSTKNQNQSNNQQRTQQQGQNRQQANQSQNNNAQQPSLHDRYNAALESIRHAKKAATLDKALETFNGTQYFGGISKACQARADQMGWTPVNQNQQQALHH